jgi:hypothetical protein
LVATSDISLRLPWYPAWSRCRSWHCRRGSGAASGNPASDNATHALPVERGRARQIVDDDVFHRAIGVVEQQCRPTLPIAAVLEF